MRLLLLILVSLSFTSVDAQLPVAFGTGNAAQSSPFAAYNRVNDSSRIPKKWQLSTYKGISASYGFWSGGNFSMISAPVGLQLDRRLTKNLYAFTGISAAPAFFSINSVFNNPGMYKNYPGGGSFNAHSLGLSSKVELGLMYINDEKTFSISGSVNMIRGYYPMYPPLNGVNTNKYHPNMNSF